jgi:hypothetical protein
VEVHHREIPLSPQKRLGLFRGPNLAPPTRPPE